MNHNDYEEPTDPQRDRILANPGIDDYELRGYFATLIMERLHQASIPGQQDQADVLMYIKMIAEQEGDGFVRLLLTGGFRYDAAIECRDWFLGLKYP